MKVALGIIKGDIPLPERGYTIGCLFYRNTLNNKIKIELFCSF